MGQPGRTAGIVMEDRAGQPVLLASDADRDTAAGMLSSAFAEGRLTSGEHAERVRAAYGARTVRELAGLTADLPGPADEVSGRPAVLVPGDGVERCLLCALLICCPPAGIAWLLAARRRARRVSPSGAAGAGSDVPEGGW